MDETTLITLEQALDLIHRLGDDDVVFARKPWNLESDAIISRLDSQLGVPKALLDKGLQYFLEVPLAKEVLSVFGARQPTDAERRQLLWPSPMRPLG